MTASETSAPRWAWPALIIGVGLCLAMVGVFVAGLVTGAISIGGFSQEYRSTTVDPVTAALALLVPLMWMAPGVVVLLRARWHAVGWFLIVTALGLGLSFDLGVAGLWDRFVPMSSAWAAWVADSWGPGVSFLGMIAVISVFPDGLGERGSATRRWTVGRLAVATLFTFLPALQSEVGGLEGNTFSSALPNPTGLGFIPAEVAQVALGPVLLLLLSSVWSLARRSRDAEVARRSQYTWVLFPFALLLLFTVVALAFSRFDWAWIPVVVLYLTIPVAFSIAMVRYRWFDIERLVSRTVTYALVAAAIAVIYAVPVVVLPGVLGFSGDLTVAGSTLLAAAAFAPLRTRVQRLVARRFDRTHYDAERVVAEFSGRLQTATDGDRLTEEVGAVLSRALGPRSITVWFPARRVGAT